MPASGEKKWSPEQIARRLRRDHPDEDEWGVSHESIYQATFVREANCRNELAACLRFGPARRRPRGRMAGPGPSHIIGMVNISERPREADNRAVPGHWEGDLIVGARPASAVATLVERAKAPKTAAGQRRTSIPRALLPAIEQHLQAIPIPIPMPFCSRARRAVRSAPAG